MLTAGIYYRKTKDKETVEKKMYKPKKQIKNRTDSSSESNCNRAEFDDESDIEGITLET